MIELDLPTFEVRLDTGVIVLRDGFVLTFFLPHSHRDVARPVREVVERYRRLPGVPAEMASPIDGIPVMQAAGTLPAVIDSEVSPARDEANLQLLDSPADAPRFSVHYYGFDLERRAKERWPGAVSVIRFTFPTDYGGEGGLLALFTFANEVANSLPFSFGYVSPAFVFLEGVGEDGAFTMIRGLAKRYRCLDIPALLPDAFEVGDGTKGAYWGNYLGQPLLERLGGTSALQAHFADREAKINPLPAGGALLYLERMPRSGDVNRQEDVTAYELAFDLFRRAMHPRRVPYMNFDEDEMVAWLHRFAPESL